MTPEEFSNEFDILLDSHSVIDKFGKGENPFTIELDEYEKSVFLTKAQEEIVIDLYSGKNPLGDSFEKTEEVRRYLSDLIKTYITTEKKTGHVGLSKTSIFFELPKDLWFITYESASLDDERLGCLDGEEVPIVPISQDDYHRISNNPFRGANKRRVLRLDNGNKIIELISEYNIYRYLVRYISRPDPIILTELPDHLSINSKTHITGCMLNPVMHRAILEKAVKLAILSKAPNTGK